MRVLSCVQKSCIVLLLIATFSVAFGTPSTVSADHSCPEGYVPQHNESGRELCRNAETGFTDLIERDAEGNWVTASDETDANGCGWHPSTWVYGCIALPAVSLLGSILVGITAFLLIIAGQIFDWLVSYTIIQFAATLESIGILNLVGEVWAKFRDLSNILIIGMFVFIAIGFILGIQEYGSKKMVARLLIVAVLINFSLFFAKFIVDTSNFLAKQFYDPLTTEIKRETGDGSIVIDGTATTTTTGIAAATMSRLGLSSVFGYNDLYTLGTTNNGSLLTVLMYAIGASIFMAVLAVIFFYGVFLLASRAVLIVFIMLTAALAFASYLLPDKFRSKTYGFETWWDSLLRTAVMAPLLMLFLWLSMYVLSGAGHGAKVINPKTGEEEARGTLGQFLQDPTTENGWQVLLLFIFTAGLLYLSMKLAALISKKTTGFNLASAIPGVGLALGNRFAALGLRQSVGHGAAAAAVRAKERAKDELDRTGTISDRTMRAIRRRESLASNSFDIMNKKFAQNIVKNAGMTKSATKFATQATGKDGYTGSKKKAEAKEQEVVGKKADIAKERISERADEEKSRLTSIGESTQKEIEALQEKRKDLERQQKDKEKQISDLRAAAVSTPSPTPASGATSGGPTLSAPVTSDPRIEALKSERDEIGSQIKLAGERIRRAQEEAEEIKGDVRRQEDIKKNAKRIAAEQIANNPRGVGIASSIRRLNYKIQPKDIVKGIEKKDKEEGKKKEILDAIGGEMKEIAKEATKEAGEKKE